MFSGMQVIKEEKREIDRFIQLNLKVQKKGDRFKFRSSKGHLIWRLGISNKIMSSKFKRKTDFMKTLLVSLRIKGWIIISRN